MACGAMTMGAVALVVPGTATGQAQAAATERCSPLFRTSTGRRVDASFSAHDYSKKNIGAVGISIFPGQDLPMNSAHSIGMKLVSAFEQNGIQAACFVHYETGPKGSGFNFKITGLSWNEDGPMDIAEATSIETLRGVAAEARTARALLK